jgi:hypothetical protein
MELKRVVEHAQIVNATQETVVLPRRVPLAFVAMFLSVMHVNAFAKKLQMGKYCLDITI